MADEDAVEVDRIARVCHEAMRAYKIARGEETLPGWDDAPDWQRQSTLEGVRFRLQNPHASPGAQHEQWAEEKRSKGWRFGQVKDAHAKTHPMLVPFEALPEQERRKDALVQAVVDALGAPLPRR